ncbi:hypothetical protein ACP70R_018463 [Stipagrostis hirtigluma subsp. patula]
MNARPKNQQGSKAVGKKSLIMPSCGGPRRFLFRIRRQGFSYDGSQSLVISNRFGLWSVGHRRYIRKTRYHRYCLLKPQLEPVARDYNSMEEKLRMSRWPEAEELVALRQKLADLYWRVMPEERKASIMRFYRKRRIMALRKQRQIAAQRRRTQQRIAAQRHRNRRRLVLFAALVVWMAVLGFVVMRLMLLGCYNDWMNLCMGSAYLVAVYLLDLAWHAC